MEKAINATTVEVTFGEEVADIKALDFAIQGLEVSNAVVKQTDKKTVVLTTSPQTAGVEYTVTVNGEEFGKFTGISAVVPTKVELVSPSVQGKLGQQVTVQAKVTVPDGQSKAGIPVTFNVPGNNNDAVNPTVTGEANTDENGVATYTYTRYAATTDAVTAYATGDRSKFATGYVFWGVDTILTITEVTEGATINNGANKTYKVTYKHPTTGNPVSGKTLNVGVKENIDVTVDKLQNVTINGTAVVQTSDSNTRAAQIKTDSKGEATFTVSGSNAEVTPVVFDAVANTVTNSNGTVTTTSYSQKYTADKLQATAAKVKFGAVQADYTIELKRDGGEVAATGLTNGRKYNVVVKTKDGKLAANETVNVAFNENIDGIISTTTKANFIKVENGKQVAWNGEKITVKTNSKGEASFIIGTPEGNNNSYATPIAWIDINNQSGKDANLDKGEPTSVAPISYFQAEYLDGSKLVSKKGTEETDKFDGNDVATFEVKLTNQSGKTVANSGYTTKDVSYTVYNTGSENVLVNGEEIAPNRVYTVISADGKLNVTSVGGKTTSVKVLATGVAKHASDTTKPDFAFTAKEATATFTNSNEISNPYTGVLDLASINKKDEEIKFAGKTTAVAYAGESGKTYKYYGIGNTTIANADAFISLLEDYASAGKTIRATYEVKDDVVTFTIISETAGTTPSDVVSKVNAATSAAQVTAALKGYAPFEKLTAANKVTVADSIFSLVTAGPITSAQLNATIEALIVVDVTAAYVAGTTGTIGAKATGSYVDETDADFSLEIESKDGGTEYNGVKVVFANNTDTTENDVTTSFASKTLTVLLPVDTYNSVTNEVIAYDANATITNVLAAIDSFNVAGDLTATAGTSLTDVEDLLDIEVTLAGATASTDAVAGTLTLTFSEAVTALTNVVVNTGTPATIAGTSRTVSADGKTVVIKLTTPEETSVSAATAVTTVNATPAVSGQTFKSNVTITK